MIWNGHLLVHMSLKIFNYTHMKKINFNLKTQDFSYTDTIINNIKQPLSLTVQVTRKCNLNCKWCSEAKQIKDPTLKDLKFLANQIKGVGRVYLSGGEPLVRDDFTKIINYYSKKFQVLALLTNAIAIDEKMAKFLKGKIKYAKVGIDGPRLINNLTRGNYDEAIVGVKNLISSGIDTSISAMLLKSNLQHIDKLIQITDILGVKQLKLIEPVRRGRSSNFSITAIPTEFEIMKKIKELKLLKKRLGWDTKIEYTFWDKKTEGYSLLVYPNLDVHIWPILDKKISEDASILVGNLYKQNIQEIWANLSIEFKKNHIAKYTGISMCKF